LAGGVRDAFDDDGEVACCLDASWLGLLGESEPDQTSIDKR
jgi:hypothetical protein